MKPCLCTGSSTQGSVTVAVSKDMRTRNVMIGWFQFQHGNSTADLWTIDNVNITLSLDRGASGGSDSGSSSSGTPAWIFGIIAAVVIIVIVALIIGAVVFLKKRSKQEQYEFATDLKKSIDHSVFENPVFGEMEDSTSTLQESSKECND